MLIKDIQRLVRKAVVDGFLSLSLILRSTNNRDRYGDCVRLFVRIALTDVIAPHNFIIAQKGESSK